MAPASPPPLPLLHARHLARVGDAGVARDQRAPLLEGPRERPEGSAVMTTRSVEGLGPEARILYRQTPRFQLVNGVCVCGGVQLIPEILVLPTTGPAASAFPCRHY